LHQPPSTGSAAIDLARTAVDANDSSGWCSVRLLHSQLCRLLCSGWLLLHWETANASVAMFLRLLGGQMLALLLVWLAGVLTCLQEC
jgi:hypothetical protein